MSLAFIRNGSQLLQGINPPGRGGLCKRYGARLGVVNILTLGGEFVNSIRSKFAVGTGGDKQFRPVGEKLWCAALIGLNMCLVTADYPVVGLAKRGQSKRIGGGAVEDKVDIAFAFEEFAKCIRGSRRPGIVSIRRCVALVGRFACAPCLGADARIIVARELLQQFL